MELLAPLLGPLRDFDGSEFGPPEVVPTAGIPGDVDVFVSAGMLLEPLEEDGDVDNDVEPDVDGDMDPDVDGEFVLPDDDIGAVLDPFEPVAIPVVPPADPAAALLPLVVVDDGLELSVMGGDAGGSCF